MSYSIIAAVLLAVVALSSSDPTNERTVLARFYPDFAQFYQSASFDNNQDESVQQYQFIFTEKEYLQIPEESLTMLYTNIIERTITYHPAPNFEVAGSRYFYRRDPKDEKAVEIELVNSEDRLFRQVRRPYLYFYLSSFDGLEYSSFIPVMPYYAVTFICNTSFSQDVQTDAPVLSYIDKSFQWSPRYLLDLPMFGAGQQHKMYAYADIRNNGEDSFVVKGTELIAGDIKLNPRPVGYYVQGTYGYPSSYSSFSAPTSSLGEQASGTYVYQLSTPSSILLPPRSVKSIKFFETNITAEPFLYYSSEFSAVNSKGKLLKAFNITSRNAYLPGGRLRLREEERFVGEVTLPDLSANETYTMIFGSDADVSYRRQVKIIQGDENGDSMTYNVQYVFENSKSSRDVRVYFIESFSPISYFEVKNISTSNDDKKFPDLVSYGTELRGNLTIPKKHGQKMISYETTIYKLKPTVVVLNKQ